MALRESISEGFPADKRRVLFKTKKWLFKAAILSEQRLTLFVSFPFCLASVPFLLMSLTTHSLFWMILSTVKQ